MAEGHSNAGICERVILSPKTLEGHVNNIFRKLDIGPHRHITAGLPQYSHSYAREARRNAPGNRRMAVGPRRRGRPPRTIPPSRHFSSGRARQGGALPGVSRVGASGSGLAYRTQS